MPSTPPLGFAHRGARLEQPDNSLAGFARALELGATALETDVWLTADGVVVLDHDGVVGRGPWRRRLRSLPAARLPSHLARIEDLYERCGAAYDLSVDVKEPAAAAPLLAAARSAGAAGRLWVCSDDAATLASWRPLDPDAHLVHSTALPDVVGVRHPYRQLDEATLGDRLGAHAERLRSAGIGTINLHHRSWSLATVATVQGHGERAFGWDIQRRDDLQRALELGLDGVYSDDVALMVAVLGSGEAER